MQYLGKKKSGVQPTYCIKEMCGSSFQHKLKEKNIWKYLRYSGSLLKSDKPNFVTTAISKIIKSVRKASDDWHLGL